MDEKRRLLSPQELMPEYEKLLEQGAELPLTVSGGSMLPFLAPERDCVYLKALNKRPEVGDIVFYKRPNGQYVLHRLCRIEGDSLWLAGDAQDFVEGPVDIKCAFAYVTRVRRKGKEENPGTALWRFFAGPWLSTVGKRQKIMKIYGKVRR